MDHRFTILLVLFFSAARSKLFDLPESWTVINDKNLEELDAAEGIGRYRLITSGHGENLASDDGTFALSFFSFTGTDKFYLAIVIRIANSSDNTAAVVWAANRRHPIQENGTLHWNTTRNALDLADSNGSIAWSSSNGQPQSSNATSIQLQESGNLALLDREGQPVWQSFDHPSDVLLEGQKTRTGARLLSSVRASSFDEGGFQISVENNGVGFYLASSMEPYFQWNLWKQGNFDRRVDTPCPSYETVLEVRRAAISMSYQATPGTTPNASLPAKCGPDLSTTLTGSRGALNFIKLDIHGDLVQRSFDASTSIWRTYSVLTSQIGACFPLECESNSLCRGGGQCQCLIESGSSSSSGNVSCPALAGPPLPCNDLEAENHRFISIANASYFSNRYTAADMVSSLDDCSRQCLGNCSCRAFFYTTERRSCYFVQEVHGSLTADPSYIAFIKVQKARLVDPSQQHRVRMIVIAVSSSAAFVVACAAAAAIYLLKKQSSRVAGTLAAALQGSLHRFTYREIKLATDNFSTLIGRGGSGSVFQGLLIDHGSSTKVAIKKLENTSQGHKEFVAEVNSIGSVSHMNIVKLCGFCAERSHRLLVYEFIANGSLDHWLFHNSNDESSSSGLSSANFLNWRTRLEIALGVARGLAYLHEESRQLIMHLDIKPQNILLDEQFVAKIADFGTSKLMISREMSNETTQVRGTPGYLAPEWLLYSVATKKCDVYSYGMVLLEIIAGRRNLASTSGSGEEDLAWYFPAWAAKKVSQGMIRDIYDRRIVAEAEEEEAARIAHIALWCIQENPALRPSMESVVKMLEGPEEVPPPPLEFHFAIQSPGIIRISTTNSTSLSFQDDQALKTIGRSKNPI